MPFITRGKTNWAFLLIVVALAFIIGPSILKYYSKIDNLSIEQSIKTPQEKVSSMGKKQNDELTENTELKLIDSYSYNNATVKVVSDCKRLSEIYLIMDDEEKKILDLNTIFYGCPDDALLNDRLSKEWDPNLVVVRFSFGDSLGFSSSYYIVNLSTGEVAEIGIAGNILPQSQNINTENINSSQDTQIWINYKKPMCEYDKYPPNVIESALYGFIVTNFPTKQLKQIDNAVTWEGLIPEGNKYDFNYPINLKCRNDELVSEPSISLEIEGVDIRLSRVYFSLRILSKNTDRAEFNQIENKYFILDTLTNTITTTADIPSSFLINTP